METEVKSKIKKAKTFEEQIEILKSRNLVIKDESEAISILQRVNYYRLSAYMLTFKENDKFNEGITFDDVYNLYKFDKELRNLILPVLESIEVAFRTHIAYLIAHKYGPLGYEDKNNFKNEKYHADMKNKLQEEINRSDELFVKHHINNYDGVFPIWVVIELTSFGTLSKIYSNLKDDDQDDIAKNFYGTKGEYLKTWLHTLSNLRNICAHYGRLYNRKFTVTPKLFKADKKRGIINDSLFANLFVMGRLLKQKTEWKHFVTKLEALVEQYDKVDLKCLGFPNDWIEILKFNKK
ncbi:MAG: ABC transporter permease [Caloramator sp.]|uniref:Abortive infection bacteriophage resistance protein n=1 Tax=Caloramator proteoclasticus DSM 10124 TaxID=1121262 RepID=A0A1M5BN04_9CLOT|nr:Abi family protein [Caloramator proteoclasticus]GIW48989.1 MAG: ABC transporter permease [Caloramator sp.]SHF43786.1 Abortive infection bacteriophage resistance protein [Caloramator proteoclasticus DSM 10124]